MATSFFTKMNNRYGSFLVNNMKDIYKIQLKLVKVLNKKLFLLRCRKQKVFSKTRRLKNTHNINKRVFEKIEQRFILSTINQEIAETFLSEQKLKKAMNKKIQLVKDIISAYFFRNFTIKLEQSFKFRYDFYKAKLINKFNKIVNDGNTVENLDLNIINTNTVANIIQDDNKWVVNLTGTDIPSTVTDVLKLGNKFCPPTTNKTVPYVKIIANIEGALFETGDETNKNIIRNELVNILTNFKNKNRHKNRLSLSEVQLLKQISHTKQFLKAHPDILVSRADKGDVTVLINRDDYFTKISLMLEDQETYEVIEKDTTLPIQRKLNSMVTSWEKGNYITSIEGKILRSHHGVVAKLYGLPKIHKENFPYRPIVSSIGTPLYELSAFLSRILKCTISKSTTLVNNSQNFIEKIKNIILPENYTILSLDVVSLFTNIDSGLVLELLEKRWVEIKQNSGTKLLKNQYIKAMDLVLNSCEFTFNKKIYKQIFGSPMGSPTSPAIADLVMQFIETSVLNSLDFTPAFFYRYVDDIITAIPTDKIQIFFESFNKFNNNIKFTIEIERNSTIAFLDLLLIHNNNGSISTDWFHKSTWSGRYLNFHSHLPISYKRNTVKLLAQKIIQLSDPIFHFQNFHLLKKTLLANGYPNYFINSLINSVLQQNSNNNQSVHNTEANYSPLKYITIPYVKSLYEQISFCLNKFNFKTVGRSYNSLGTALFSSLKDPTALSNKKDVVYKITCECNKIYIGQTQQLLGTRFCQHKRDAQKLVLNKLNKESTSALSAHLFETKHNLNLENVKVLENETNTSTRRALEMIHIKSNILNSLNKQSDFSQIQNIYDNLI